MMQSVEAIDKLTTKARMAETALGISLVAGIMGLWPAWALVPIYGVMAASNEYKKNYLKNTTLSYFEVKPVDKRLRRPE